MIRPALLLTLGLSASIARADEPVVCAPVELASQAVSPAMRLHVPELALSEAQEAQRLRNAGIGVTVVGTVLTLVGVGVFMGNFCMDSCSHGSDAGINASIALMAVGQVAVFSGIPIWAVGQTRASRAERAVVSLSATAATLSF